MTAESSSKTLRAIIRLRRLLSNYRQSSARERRPSPVLLGRRLAALGFDPRVVALTRPDAYVNMISVCASCSEHRRCLDDLTEGDVEAGRYCPNAGTIRTLL
jgi:hypothetical protein